ncbi:unnamed protein product, partial [Polarella glacialis]
ATRDVTRQRRLPAAARLVLCLALLLLLRPAEWLFVPASLAGLRISGGIYASRTADPHASRGSALESAAPLPLWARERGTSFIRRSAARSEPEIQPVENILGRQLQQCSADPLTGWYRDGFCRTDESDGGRHLVC